METLGRTVQSPVEIHFTNPRKDRAMSQQFIPYYDEKGVLIGQETKQVVYRDGLWHKSALLLVCQAGRVLTITRGQHQSFAGRIDIPGGHEDPADLAEAGDVHLRTAFREASEELSLYHRFAAVGRSGWYETWKRDAFKAISQPCEMTVDSPANREWSTLVGVRIHEFYDVEAKDIDDNDALVSLNVAWLSLAELLCHFASEPEFCADGLGRVLLRMMSDQDFSQRVSDFVEAGDWLICFACTTPAEPGCGCPDNDFYAEHEFSADYEDAKLAAGRISRANYFDDFQYWIAPR
jgi:8-oxo-dGTP pyrophosphatase MutT (NUDIX family)